MAIVWGGIGQIPGGSRGPSWRRFSTPRAHLPSTSICAVVLAQPDDCLRPGPAMRVGFTALGPIGAPLAVNLVRADALMLSSRSVRHQGLSQSNQEAIAPTCYCIEPRETGCLAVDAVRGQPASIAKSL